MRLVVSILCALTLLILAVAPASSAPPRPPRYDLSGHVAGMSSHHRALVRITGHRVSRSVSTHPDGTFVFRNLPPGSYTVRPQHAGFWFSPSFHTVAIRNHDAHGVDFTARPRPPRR